MVKTLRAELGKNQGTAQRVATQLGYERESARFWVTHTDIDGGKREGVPSDSAAEIRRLEQELREVKRANEILKKAASFLGAEPDRQNKESVVFVRANKVDIVEGRKLGVELICRVLQVAPKTYCAARGRLPSTRALDVRCSRLNCSICGRTISRCFG